MAQVELKAVTKIYDPDVLAVDKADLVINDKEFLVLVGPSGCGKSTLLRMIAGLEEISGGEIYIDDKLVNDIPPKNRDIAMVFQNYALYPHMSVFENMAFGLKLRKIPKADIKKRVEEAAALLHITEYLERRPKALSGGQRQRVAVGRAIVRKPKVFLFDEPLSNLDAKLRVQMRIEIIRLHQRLQTTMIYVTHDQVEAMTMGTRIVVLKDGLIQQVDSPLNLYRNPVNQFVAGFIGSPAMNFFTGKLSGTDQIQFSSSIFSIDIPGTIKAKLQDQKETEILLGVRPEDILVGNGTDSGLSPASQPVQMDVVEPVGNEVFGYFSDSDITHCLRCAPEHHLVAGQKIPIAFRTDRMLFFKKETGERIV